MNEDELEERRQSNLDLARSVKIANYTVSFSFSLALIAGWFALYKTGDNPSLWAFWLPTIALFVNYLRGEWAIEHLEDASSYIKHITSHGRIPLPKPMNPSELDDFPKIEIAIERFIYVVLLISLFILMASVM